MKIKKNLRNIFKHHLLNSKTYKLFSSELNVQVIKIKNLELQVKKLIKLFFEVMLKNQKSKNFIFSNLVCSLGSKSLIFDKSLLNISYLRFCTEKNLVNYSLLSKIFTSSFIQIFGHFYTTYLKYNKISKVMGDLTNIILTDDITSIKKIKFFYGYNYLMFWNSMNIRFLFKFFQFLILKVSKRKTRFKF